MLAVKRGGRARAAEWLPGFPQGRFSARGRPCQVQFGSEGPWSREVFLPQFAPDKNTAPARLHTAVESRQITEKSAVETAITQLTAVVLMG